MAGVDPQIRYLTGQFLRPLDDRWDACSDRERVRGMLIGCAGVCELRYSPQRRIDNVAILEAEAFARPAPLRFAFRLPPQSDTGALAATTEDRDGRHAAGRVLYRRPSG